MKEWLISYLTFSKKERLGITVLMLLILTIWLLPEYFGKSDSISPELVAKADSLIGTKHVGWKDQNDSNSHSRLFDFDPNSISDSEWQALGLKAKTVSIIRNYLQKGGRFREPADLARIYGLRHDQAEQLMPYVRIRPVKIPTPRRVSWENRSERMSYPKRKLSGPISYNAKFGTTDRTQTRHTQLKYKPRRSVDLSTSDSMELESLPGIGTKLSSRIVRFREALGGFHSIEQLKDVYGVDDSLFSLISTFITISSGVYRKVRINHWGADSLDLHPYIQRHEAKAIVNYRNQHGRFAQVEDLEKINLITQEWITRIKPYIELE